MLLNLGSSYCVNFYNEKLFAQLFLWIQLAFYFKIRKSDIKREIIILVWTKEKGRLRKWSSGELCDNSSDSYECSFRYFCSIPIKILQNTLQIAVFLLLLAVLTTSKALLQCGEVVSMSHLPETGDSLILILQARLLAN